LKEKKKSKTKKMTFFSLSGGWRGCNIPKAWTHCYFLGMDLVGDLVGYNFCMAGLVSVSGELGEGCEEGVPAASWFCCFHYSPFPWLYLFSYVWCQWSVLSKAICQCCC